MKISGPITRPNLSKVRVYPQDSAVSGTTEEFVSKDSIGDRLEGPRMGIVTGRREFKASADKDGNYLYSPGTKKFNQVQAFVAAQKTLDLFEGYAERELPWAFDSQQLGVIPHAGEGKNAYYARWNQSVSFYSFSSRHLGKTVHVAQSADVVSHETGHAILDGMKPEWGKTFDRETKATHEAFGDCAAMALTISRPESRKMALDSTSGDLRKDNVISSIAEEFGTAVRLANRDPDDDKPYLRNANNKFAYKPPKELPRNGSREELSSESHSFCQIFTRAYYNAIVNIYEANLASGQSPDAALEDAGSTVGSLLAKGITMSAPNRARFADVAKAMLRADRLEGSSHQGSLGEAFLDSEILNTDDLEELKKPLPQGTPDEVLATLDFPAPELTRTVTDRDGNQTREYLSTTQDTRAGMLGFGGPTVTLDVSAGVSLTYNSDGKLVHLATQDADPEAEWNGLPDLQTALMSNGEVPETRVLPQDDGYKIERLPIFIGAL